MICFSQTLKKTKPWMADQYFSATYQLISGIVWFDRQRCKYGIFQFKFLFCKIPLQKTMPWTSLSIVSTQQQFFRSTEADSTRPSLDQSHLKGEKLIVD